MSLVKRMRILAAISLFAALGTSCSSGGGAGPVDPLPPPAERPAFDEARAFADLEAQVAFGPRVPGSQAHDDCLAFLTNRLQQAGAQVVTQEFTATTGLSGQQAYDFTNVAGLFAGDAEGEVLLLGAHWDSRAIADQDPDPARRTQPVPGANDGASGVAVLLEMARAFSVQAPPRPVIIAFFDAEDQGGNSDDLPDAGWIIGSRRMANHWPQELPRPAQMVLLDLVGGDNRPNPRLGTPGISDDIFRLPIELESLDNAPALVDEIWSIAERLGHTAFVRNGGRSITDDHIPFIEAGIPSVDIIEFHPPEWHTTDDTPEHCSPDSLNQVGETLLEFIYGD